MTATKPNTAIEPDVDVDWGGEHVFLRVLGGPTRVAVDLTDTTADGMLAQLVWAVSEVRRFRAHMAAGGRASLFPREPKPGHGGASHIVAAAMEQLGVELCQLQQEMRDEDDRGIRASGLGAGIERIRDRVAQLRGEQP